MQSNKCMLRTVGRVALTMAIAASMRAADATPLVCLASLPIPLMPQLVRVLGPGEVKVLLKVANDGNISSVEVRSQNTGLAREVREILSGTQVSSRCRNRSLELIFAYTLRDVQSDDASPSVVWRSPNRFEIVVSRPRPTIYLER